MRKKILILFTIFLSNFILTNARASQSQYELKTSVSNSSILVGQKLEIYFEIPNNKKLILPDIDDEVSGFKVLSFWDTITSDQNWTYIAFSVTRFDTGYAEFKPLQFIIDGDTAYSSSMMIYVGLPELIDSIEIYDLKSNITYYDNRWILVIVGLVFLAVLIYYGIKIFNSKKRGTQSRKDESLLSLEDQFIERIQDCRRRYKNNEIDGREFYFSIDELIRSFLEQKYSKKFLESTTPEVCGLLLTLPMSIYFIESLQQFFTKAELVKFAKVDMDSNQTEVMIEKMIEFLKSEKFNPFDVNAIDNAQIKSA